MLIKQFANRNNPRSISNNDELIRHIMDYDYNLIIGQIEPSSFQTDKLMNKGISVSIDKLLNSFIRDAVIKSLEKNKHTYICDCKAFVLRIYNIIHDGHVVFDVNFTPLLMNPAHADIKFSSFSRSFAPSLQKKYKKKLMNEFKIV